MGDTGGAGSGGATMGGTGGAGGATMGATGGAGGANTTGCSGLALACGLSRPWGIAVDGTNVYFTDVTFSSLLAVPIAGGTPTLLASTGQSSFYGAVAANAAGVFWTDGETVNSLGPLGAGAPTTLFTGGQAIYGIALGATNLYFTDADAYLVMEAPIAGGPVKAFSSCPLPWAIATDSNNVYFIDSQVGAVLKEPQTDTSSMATELWGGPGFVVQTPSAIAVDSTSVYWTNQVLGTVMRMPKSGGAVTPIASGQAGPWGIAVDATHVYWTNTGSSDSCPDNGNCPSGFSCLVGKCVPDSGAPPCPDCTVMRAPVAGGAPMVFAAGQNLPVNIALDDENVYWTNAGNGTVMKAPK
jgi:hypothetical protein